jgi:hypothetical protein
MPAFLPKKKSKSVAGYGFGFAKEQVVYRKPPASFAHIFYRVEHRLADMPLVVRCFLQNSHLNGAASGFGWQRCPRPLAAFLHFGQAKAFTYSDIASSGFAAVIIAEKNGK